MTLTSAFKSPEGEAAFLDVYDSAMKLWPVPYEEIEVPTRFGMTHVVTSGPIDAPPLVLLHGYYGTLTMWLPNISDFSENYRVYAIDIMGQPGRSTPQPDQPIRDVADFVEWLVETLDTLNLERTSLVGMSYGGWVALNCAISQPQRVQKLVLLSPAGSFQMLTTQFTLRGLLMISIPKRLTVNSFMGWMGFKATPGDKITQTVLQLIYLGVKYFRIHPETGRIMAGMVSDGELRELSVPVLLLMGEHEVIYDPAKALSRARTLIPIFEGELVPDSSHDMCISQHQIVNARVTAFLNGS